MDVKGSSEACWGGGGGAGSLTGGSSKNQLYTFKHTKFFLLTQKPKLVVLNEDTDCDWVQIPSSLNKEKFTNKMLKIYFKNLTFLTKDGTSKF